MQENQLQTQNIKILLVDDEDAFLETLAFLFRRSGFQVLLASSGREAFATIESQKVDIVVSDIRMPDGNGVWLLDRIKEKYPQIPVILLVTGFAEVTTEEIFNKGAEALFCKPFNRKHLQDTVMRILSPLEKKWALHRTNANVDVALKFQERSDSIQTKVVCLEEKSMFIAVNRIPFPNTHDMVSFRLDFNMADSPAIDGRGIVRWVRTKDTPQFPAGCDIEFSYLCDRAHQTLSNLLLEKNP